MWPLVGIYPYRRELEGFVGCRESLHDFEDFVGILGIFNLEGRKNGTMYPDILVIQKLSNIYLETSTNPELFFGKYELIFLLRPLIETPGYIDHNSF